MSSAAFFWIVVFAIATALFFVTAVVITIIGVRDLRDLISGPVRRAEPSQAPVKK